MAWDASCEANGQRLKLEHLVDAGDYRTVAELIEASGLERSVVTARLDELRRSGKLRIEHRWCAERQRSEKRIVSTLSTAASFARRGADAEIRCDACGAARMVTPAQLQRMIPLPTPVFLGARSVTCPACGHAGAAIAPVPAPSAR